MTLIMELHRPKAPAFIAAPEGLVISAVFASLILTSNSMDQIIRACVLKVAMDQAKERGAA